MNVKVYRLDRQEIALPLTWVWRKRGSNSPESMCRFASFAPVRAAVEAPPAPSPCSLAAISADTVREKRKGIWSLGM